MFTNAQNMYQIICRNIQALKCHTKFQNISSKFIFAAIYNEPSSY